jgi:hypothetical protein
MRPQPGHGTRPDRRRLCWTVIFTDRRQPCRSELVSSTLGRAMPREPRVRTPRSRAAPRLKVFSSQDERLVTVRQARDPSPSAGAAAPMSIRRDTLQFVELSLTSGKLKRDPETWHLSDDVVAQVRQAFGEALPCFSCEFTLESDRGANTTFKIEITPSKPCDFVAKAKGRFLEVSGDQLTLALKVNGADQLTYSITRTFTAAGCEPETAHFPIAIALKSRNSGSERSKNNKEQKRQREARRAAAEAAAAARAAAVEPAVAAAAASDDDDSKLACLERLLLDPQQLDYGFEGTVEVMLLNLQLQTDPLNFVSGFNML